MPKGEAREPASSRSSGCACGYGTPTAGTCKLPNKAAAADERHRGCANIQLPPNRTELQGTPRLRTRSGGVRRPTIPAAPAVCP